MNMKINLRKRVNQRGKKMVERIPIKYRIGWLLDKRNNNSICTKLLNLFGLVISPTLEIYYYENKGEK